MPMGSLPARLPGEMLQQQLCRAGGAVKHRPAAPSAGLPGGVNTAAAGFNPRGSSTLTIFRKPAFGFSQKSCPVVGLSRHSACAASAGLRLLASCVTLVQTFCSAVVLFHFSSTQKYWYFLAQQLSVCCRTVHVAAIKLIINVTWFSSHFNVSASTKIPSGFIKLN